MQAVMHRALLRRGRSGRYHFLFGKTLPAGNQSRIRQKGGNGASTSLYEALRRYCISGNGKTENLIQSIRKFLNRAATRTTPFGLFAGVEFGNLGDKTDIELNCISQYYKRARVDMEWLSKIVIICENNPTYWNHLRFRFNSDCYEAGNRLLAPGLKLQVQRE